MAITYRQFLFARLEQNNKFLSDKKYFIIWSNRIDFSKLELEIQDEQLKENIVFETFRYRGLLLYRAVYDELKYFTPRTGKKLKNKTAAKEYKLKNLDDSKFIFIPDNERDLIKFKLIF